MAELSLGCCQSNSQVVIPSGSGISLSRRVLVRTGGSVPANTVINLNSPGVDWVVSGNSVTFSGSSDFTDNTQFYRNGQILLTGENSSANNDVYFSSSPDNVAFEFPIVSNDILQIWKFSESTSGSGPTDGLTEQEHEVLDTLVHNISEDATVEIVRNSNNQVTGVNFRSNPGNVLIRSTTIVRNSAGQVIQTIETQYNGSGVAIQTLTTDVNRTNNQVTSMNLTET
jgi:hypothetical protein